MKILLKNLAKIGIVYAKGVWCMIITIDGLASTGKTTAGTGLAKRIGFGYLGTGALYRALTIAYIRAGANYENKADVEKVLKETKITVSFENSNQKTFLNGEDVTGLLKEKQVANLVAKISPIHENRVFIRKIQHKIGNNTDVVVEGRDIGSVVFPHADVKFFFSARPDVRAIRRFEELKRLGKDITFEEVLRETVERDKLDQEREESPMVIPEDAIVVDTSDSTLEEVIDFMEKQVQKKMQANAGKCRQM